MCDGDAGVECLFGEPNQFEVFGPSCADSKAEGRVGNLSVDTGAQHVAEWSGIEGRRIVQIAGLGTALADQHMHELIQFEQADLDACSLLQRGKRCCDALGISTEELLPDWVARDDAAIAS